MRKNPRAVLLVLLGWLPACGGGGNGVAEVIDLAAFSDCTELRFTQVGEVVDLLRDLVDEASGLDVSGMEIAPGQQPNTFDFTASVDLDGDALAESTARGSVAFSADPSDGIEPGDEIGMQLASLTGGPVNGNAVLQCVVLEGNAVRISPGSATVSASGACGLQVTAADLVLPFVSGAFPVGTVDFTLTIGGNTLVATIDFDGTTTASIDGTVDGTVPVQFEVTFQD